jgi:hypothetical protein
MYSSLWTVIHGGRSCMSMRTLPAPSHDALCFQRAVLSGTLVAARRNNPSRPRPFVESILCFALLVFSCLPTFRHLRHPGILTASCTLLLLATLNEIDNKEMILDLTTFLVAFLLCSMCFTTVWSRPSSVDSGDKELQYVTVLEQLIDGSNDVSSYNDGHRQSKPFAPLLYARTSLGDVSSSRVYERDSARAPSGKAGHTVEKQAAGEKCGGANDSCKYGLFCSMATDTCQQKRERGGTCRSDLGCIDSLSCVNGTCREARPGLIDDDRAPTPTDIYSRKRAAASGAPFERKILRRSA